MITVKQILDVKGSQVWTIAPEGSVFEGLALMAEKNLGALVAMRDDRVVGIVTERDYARKVVLKGKLSRETPIEEIMTFPVYGVRLDTTADECMGIMTNKRFRHLPVLESEKLVGLVSIGDIVNAIISEQRVTISHLEGYITGKYPG